MMESFKDFQLYLFDLDDTLASTRQTIDFACNQVLDNLSEVSGIPLEELQPLLFELKALFGSTTDKEYWTAFVQALSRGNSIDATKLIETYRQYYWKALCPMPGALELLKKLATAKKSWYYKQWRTWATI